MKYNKIILSGRRNVGKTTLFWNLQKRLNWPTFSISQYLRDYIRIHGLQGASSTVMSEHDVKMGEDIAVRLEELLKTEYPCLIEARLFEHIREAFPGTMKLLLTADEMTRVKRNARREDISVEKSAKRLVKREDKWIIKMQEQFGFGDFYDPKYYDLTVNTTNLTPEEVVEVVVSTL